MSNEQINTLLNILAKQQAELESKDKQLKVLQTENSRLKLSLPNRNKTNNSSVYSVTRKSGKVVYGFTIYDENMRKIRREGFLSKTEAETERRKLLNLRDKRQLSILYQNQKQKFSYFCEAYMTKAKANFAINTIESAKGIINNHLTFFVDMPIPTITKLKAEEWSNERRKNAKPSAFNNALKLVKAIWNNALEKELTDIPNPFNHIEPINIRKECKTRKKIRIDNTEAEQLIQTALKIFPNEFDYTAYAIATAYYGGLREGEVFGLKWSDFNFSNKSVHVQRQVQKITKKVLKKILAENPNLTEKDVILTDRLKTEASNDVIAIPTILVELLLSYRKKLMASNRINELCFCKPNGSPVVCRDFVRSCYQKVLKEVFGDKNYMTFHELRGSCATTMHKKGVPSKIIQGVLRHDKLSTTEDIYISIDKTSNEVSNQIEKAFSAF